MRAYAVIEEILTGKTVALFRSSTATGAEKMATFARKRSEASALPALGRAVRLRILLTVLRTFAPATLRATIIARWTGAFRCRKIIHVKISSSLTGDYFLPIDSSDVAEIVVVVHAHASVEYIYDEINE